MFIGDALEPISVPSHGMAQLSVIRPGRPKGRMAVFGQDSGPYRARHFSSGQGGGRRRTGEDACKWGGMTEDGGGQRGKAGDCMSDVS